jgi:AraC-like DNA-binding protein/nuclear transport factor 2 (NTF2) superfamily protein
MTMTVDEWVESYRQAWIRRDPEAAAALFTEDATYREDILQEPNTGRSGIVDYWTRVTAAQSEVQVRMGKPFVDGNRVAVEFWTNMLVDGDPATIPGILLLDFTDEGLCRPESGARTGLHYPAIVTPEELADLAHLRRARDLMDREYDRPLDVAAIARTALMSPAHFSRRFRAAYGETPYAYLMTRRIERAKALLRRGEMSVTEVCMAVGCTSLGSFSTRFTEVVGETPSAYRIPLDHRWLGLTTCRVDRAHELPQRKSCRQRHRRRTRRQGCAQRRPLPHRRSRWHVREGASRRSGDRLGAGRSAVGDAGLRSP